jgi:peptidoglycan hydrolase CwlO-like protein
MSMFSDKKKALENQIYELTQKFDTAEAARVELAKQVSDLTEKLDAKKTALEKAHTDLNDAKTRIAALEEDAKKTGEKVEAAANKKAIEQVAGLGIAPIQEAKTDAAGEMTFSEFAAQYGKLKGAEAVAFFEAHAAKFRKQD